MFKDMVDVFTRATTDDSAYTEIVMSTDPNTFAVEAVVGWGHRASDKKVHENILRHFGLNERQLPLLSWGPGLKENNKCKDATVDCPLVW